jgi:hypothetical protein
MSAPESTPGARVQATLDATGTARQVEDDLGTSWDWYAKRARVARRADRVSDVTLLIFGAVIPAAALLAEPWSTVLGVCLGICVVINTGLRRVFTWKENWIRFTGACVELATASMYYRHKIAPYDADDPALREQALATRIRQIEETESRSWMTSNASQATSQSAH